MKKVFQAIRLALGFIIIVPCSVLCLILGMIFMILDPGDGAETWYSKVIDFLCFKIIAPVADWCAGERSWSNGLDTGNSSERSVRDKSSDN